MPVSFNNVIEIIPKLIDKYDLNLNGKVVLTEAASFAYKYNPLIAIMAGAKKVIVYCKDSKYGKSQDILCELHSMADIVKPGVLFIADKLEDSIINQADIVTNSGHLRPFKRSFFEAMHSKAVLALMWEPWEIRNGEIDFDAARSNGILIMGTNEHEYPCNMKTYCVMLAIKLLTEHNPAYYLDKIVIVGDQELLAIAIYDGLLNIGLNVSLISPTASTCEIDLALHNADYLLIAEHHNINTIVGQVISIDNLKHSKIKKIGLIAGQVDMGLIETLQIDVYPKPSARHGYINYGMENIGIVPVIDLFSAGLKVGQAMSLARTYYGFDCKFAAKYALNHSPALDLLGDFAWIDEN